MKLGRKRPDGSKKRLELRNYLDHALLPTPPDSCDYTPAAAPALSNIYGNDQLGDCVIAGGYHVVGVATGNAGDLFVASQDQIVADYSAIGGYVPGNESTDNGCDEQTAMQYWTTAGFANGTKLAGWCPVLATNEQEMRIACYLFEHLYFGAELPDGWINPMPNGPGFVWDVAGDPVPSNGHCVMGAGYSALGVTIDTWGMLGTLTWEAAAKYCVTASGGEVYVMLTPDLVAKGQAKAPNGFAWDDLQRDLLVLQSAA